MLVPGELQNQMFCLVFHKCSTHAKLHQIWEIHLRQILQDEGMEVEHHSSARFLQYLNPLLKRVFHRLIHTSEPVKLSMLTKVSYSIAWYSFPVNPYYHHEREL